jgi:hypothetical protein
MKCIYCVEDKPPTSFAKAEHVMPQSFGLFVNNFTLREMVCDDCNQYFGDNLEIALARDTLEGASRFEFELKSQKEFKSLGKRSRMIIKIAEGECKGAYAYRDYSQEQDKIVIRPVPQIGFLKNIPSEYEYFLLDQVPEKSYLEENGFDLNDPRAIRVFGIDVDTAREFLAVKGISFKPKGEAGPSGDQQEDWLCKVDALIDDTVFRAIAKIALNYIGYWEGTEFLLHQSFNLIRKFIRHGERSGYTLVRVDDKPILADEPVEGKRRLGHIITVNWAADKVSIVSHVSLFNWATYAVSLARGFSGEQRNIKRGHFFNVHSREILELEAR